MNARKLLLLLPALLFVGCQVLARPGGGLEVVPVLPAVVEIGDDAYYTQGGYHYFYTGDSWFYATSRDGERHELPRSHWPRETRRRGGERH